MNEIVLVLLSVFSIISIIALIVYRDDIRGAKRSVGLGKYTYKELQVFTFCLIRAIQNKDLTYLRTTATHLPLEVAEKALKYIAENGSKENLKLLLDSRVFTVDSLRVAIRLGTLNKANSDMLEKELGKALQVRAESELARDYVDNYYSINDLLNYLNKK